MDINYYRQYEPIDGKWYITKELGSGSYGTVFEIQRKDFPEMKSALKIISVPSTQNEVRSYKEENYDLDDESVTSYFYGFVEEFIKEFKLMSQLKGNSNIVSYEDHDIKKHETGIGWDILIRMELLTPLGKYLSDNKPDQDTAIKLGIDICKALEVCQKYNIIHRDIKPSNIFVSDNGDFKLGDFGVARTLEKTSSGLSKKGTYTYMAPEVFKGEKYNAAVDIYSLGIVMYKLLNNNFEPFRKDRSYSDGDRAMALRMSGARPEKPQNANDALGKIILKACSFKPEDRYQSPSQMRADLENINDKTIGMFGDSGGKNKDEKKKYLKIGAIAAGVILAASMCFFVFGRLTGGKMHKTDVSPTASPTANPTASPTAAGELVSEDKNIVIELYPTEEVSDEELKEMSEIISERAKLLEVNYKVGVSDGKISVEIDRNFGESPKIKKCIADILMCDGKLAINSSNWPPMEKCEEYIDEITVESKTKDEFKNSYGNILNEYTMEKALGEAGNDIYYLHLKFNDAFPADFEKSVKDEDWKKLEGVFDLQLDWDEFHEGAESYRMTRAGAILNVDNKQNREFIFIPYEAAASEKAVKMLKQVLSAKPLKCIMTGNISEEPEWETGEKTSGNQTAKLSGNYIDIEYEFETYDSMYLSKYKDEVQLLKNRLDEVGLPYAIGCKGLSREKMVVRISPEKFSDDIPSFLAAFSGVSICMDDWYHVDVDDIEINDAGNGHYSLKASTGTDKTTIISDYLEEKDGDDTVIIDIDALDGENEKIYLTADGMIIAETTLSALQDDGTVTFSNLSCFGKDSIDKDDYWLLKLVDGYADEGGRLNGSHLPLSDISVRYYENGWFVTDDITKIPWKYKGYGIEPSIEETAKKYGASAKKTYERGEIEFELDIKKDENFAKNFMNTIEKIYTECDLDNSSYWDVSFFDKESGKTNPNNKAFVSFVMHDFGLSVSDYGFGGPEYRKYKKEVRKILKTNKFWHERCW